MTITKKRPLNETSEIHQRKKGAFMFYHFEVVLNSGKEI